MTVWQKKEPPKYEENEEKTIQVMMTKNQHKMRRVISEAVLEKELTWHFEKGDCYHCFSWGDVDSLTYLRVIVKQQKLKFALISSWCISQTDIREIFDWIGKGYIGRVDFYVGEIFKGSYEKEWDLLCKFCKLYGCRLVIFRNHSKIMLAFGENFDAVIESSANVNTNPRSENTVITIDTKLAYWYKDIFDNIKPFNTNFEQPPIFELQEVKENGKT